MSSFDDSTGRSWTLRIDVSAIRRVREALDVDLLDLAGGPLLERVAGDPVLLVDILYVLSRGQADQQNVDAEAFGAAMVGDAIDRATGAMLEALADFFPSRKAAILRTVTEKGQVLAERLLVRAEKQVADGALDAAMEKLMEKLAAESGGSASRPPPPPV